MKMPDLPGSFQPHLLHCAFLRDEAESHDTGTITNEIRFVVKKKEPLRYIINIQYRAKVLWEPQYVSLP